MCQAGKGVLILIIDKKVLYGLLNHRITNLSGKKFLDEFRGTMWELWLFQWNIRF